jgi:hypothetical protein
MTHIVLLGDSILDNAPYVRGGPDVVRQVRTRLGERGQATLLAMDGSIVEDVARQCERLAPDATHLVVSAGGNDALGHMDFLERPAGSVAAVLHELGAMATAFEATYTAMVDAVLAHRLPTALCTVYYPSFPDPRLQRVAVAALTVFNDAILRTAFARRLPVLDLRLICDSPADYANPIEPSVAGGEKIAAVIVAWAAAPPNPGHSAVYGPAAG